jgi:hypothetical protein
MLFSNVEIQAYGNFDVPYTHTIVESENHTKDSLKGLMQEYSVLMKLKPHKAMNVDCPTVPQLSFVYPSQITFLGSFPTPPFISRFTRFSIFLSCVQSFG